jgi:hypothetical protein
MTTSQTSLALSADDEALPGRFIFCVSYRSVYHHVQTLQASLSAWVHGHGYGHGHAQEGIQACLILLVLLPTRHPSKLPITYTSEQLRKHTYNR